MPTCLLVHFSTRPLVCLLFSAFTLSLSAQTDTRGTDFWLTFGKNANYHTDRIDNVTLQIKIVAENQNVKGYITFTNLRDSVPFSVVAHQVYTYPLTRNQKIAAYNSLAGNVSGKTNYSIHITTDHPVAVYALNQVNTTTDATNILPITALGTNYFAISYKVISSTTPNATRKIDAYVVVATQNNTQICYGNGLSVKLNRGEVYYRTSTADMTGERLTADKPVAFFAVHQGTEIPNGYCCVDHLFQQLPPVHTWGKNFFVPTTHLGKERVRIVVSQDNTNITVTGGIIVDGQSAMNNLQAGQWVELEITRAETGCHIQANHPVGVSVYLVSTIFNTPSGNENEHVGSDPAQAWIPAIEQAVKSALIAPFISLENTALEDHYAFIITPTATKHNTRVKTGLGAEKTLQSDLWMDHPSSEMSFFPLWLYENKSSCLLTNPAGLLVMGWGMGTYESYYYLAASSMRILDVAFYVNDTHFQDITLNDRICNGQDVQIRAEIEEQMSSGAGHIKWYINDVPQKDVEDSLHWEKYFVPGVYEIRMDVLTIHQTIRTAATTITVEEPQLNQPENRTFCIGKTVPSTSFTGTDIDTVIWTAVGGTQIGMSTENGTGNIPAFKAINNDTAALTVTMTAIPKNANGCEGKAKTWTVTVEAETDLTVELGNDTAFCKEDVIYYKLDVTNANASSYLWQDSSTSPVYIVRQQGIYEVMLSNRCMSVSDKVEIGVKECKILPYIPIEEEEEEKKEEDTDLEIWIPNAFTPDEDEINDLFKPKIRNPELLKEYEMVIYNRWGNLIFRTQDYLAGWNGKDSKNKYCNEGIYVTVFRYKNTKGKEFIKSTSVTLIR